MLKSLSTPLILISVLVFYTACATKETSEQTNSSAIVSSVVEVTATVTAIDRDQRTAKLKGPRGNTVTVHVPESAPDFDKVDVGDLVDFKYFESVALDVHKTSGEPSLKIGGNVNVSAPGENPGFKAVDVEEITAVVENIDHDRQIVTLALPGGETIELDVHKRDVDLSLIDNGDQVIARYTRAISIHMKELP